MTSYNIVREIVSKVLANSRELPEDYRDADETTRRRVERMAEEQGTTAAEVWHIVRAQHAQDIASAREGNTGFDPEAIARAARR